MKDEKEKCNDCEQPAVASRWKAGEKNWICSNGHNWTSKDSIKKDAAKQQEERKKLESAYGRHVLGKL